MTTQPAALTETTLFGIRLCVGDMQTAVDSIAQHAQLGAGGRRDYRAGYVWLQVDFFDI
jgi:hypothetical protein